MRASETTTPPANGVAPPERPGARAARHERHAIAVAGAEDRLHLLRRARKNDELRDRAMPGQPVALVRPELLQLRDDVVAAERTAQLGDEGR